MSKVSCRISDVYLQSEDTLFIDIQGEERFTFEDFKELKKAALKLGKGKRFYNIIKVGAFTLPDKDAREASCSVEGSFYKKADAFVINTLPQKLIGNLMLRINKPVVPTKFFKSVADAELWLNSLRKTDVRAQLI